MFANKSGDAGLVHGLSIDEFFNSGANSISNIAPVIASDRHRGNLETRAVVLFKKPRHQERRRMLMKVRGK